MSSCEKEGVANRHAMTFILSLRGAVAVISVFVIV